MNSINLRQTEIYNKKDFNNKNNHKNQSFKGGVVDAATAVLQFCNTNPMAGVSLIDGVTAIAPRTIVDAKTNGFAAAETFRRESSGLIVNCLIPGFFVLGAAKLMEAFGSKENKGLSNLWANQDSLEELSKHFNATEEKTGKSFVYKLFDDIHVNAGNKWHQIKHDEIKPQLDKLAELIDNKTTDKKLINQVKKEVYDAILEKYKGAEHIKFGKTGSIYHDNLSTLLRDTVDVGKKFVDLKDAEAVNQYVKRATKFINKKSLAGLAVIIPLAASMQSINRWITKKSSGTDGAPIYKDFGSKKHKKEMSTEEKSKFWTNKIASAGLMVGVAILSMMKKPSLKMLQFNKNMPSMDQCRWIATSTFASRMLAAEDKNELSEVTWRDIATFSSLYFLGDYVAKGVATLIQKVKKVELLNYTKEAQQTKNPLKKFGYWVKDTKLKSFDEAKALGGNKAKGLRAICELSSLGFSMLTLGILVPWYVRKQTEIKEQRALREKFEGIQTNPSLIKNKKAFQAFGMLMEKTK